MRTALNLDVARRLLGIVHVVPRAPARPSKFNKERICFHLALWDGGAREQLRKNRRRHTVIPIRC